MVIKKCMNKLNLSLLWNINVIILILPGIFYQNLGPHCLFNSNINSVILIILVESRVSWKGNEYWQPYFLLYSKKVFMKEVTCHEIHQSKFLFKSEKKKFREKNWNWIFMHYQILLKLNTSLISILNSIYS